MESKFLDDTSSEEGDAEGNSNSINDARKIKMNNNNNKKQPGSDGDQEDDELSMVEKFKSLKRDQEDIIFEEDEDFIRYRPMP